MSADERRSIRLLDPAFGTGAFLTSALRVFGAESLASVDAVEIDQSVLEGDRIIWASTPLNLVPGDFTRLDSAPFARASLLVCNPPYVRHHHLKLEEKKRLQLLSSETAGVKLSLQAGLYCHFMLLADRWLDSNALCVWLVPSEILDAKYGMAIKKYLTRNVTLVRVHRYSQSDLHFDDALVASTVIWYRKKKPTGRPQVTLTVGGSVSAPEVTNKTRLKDLPPDIQWTTDFMVHLKRPERHNITLGDLFDIKRGLATGANKFFIMTEEQARERNIPDEFLKPILPPPRKVTQDRIPSGPGGRPLNVDQLLLFDTQRPVEELMEHFPNTWQYLNQGVSEGIPEKHLCRSRTPWYSQENRPPAPFLSAYVGRNSENVQGFPVRFIMNQSMATATNSYLMLYPKPLLAKLLNSYPDLQLGIWKALQRLGSGPQVTSGRAYGGGLVKLEPKELALVTAVPIIKYIQGKGHDLGTELSSE